MEEQPAPASSEPGVGRPPQRLRTDDPLLATLVRQLADAVVVADPDGTIAFWNDASSRLFGWTAEEVIGRDLDMIIPERFRDRHRAGYERVMATGTTRYGTRLLEVPALHRDGHRFSIAFTVTLLDRPGSPGPVGIVAVIRDDTARRQELQDLREQVAALRPDELG